MNILITGANGYIGKSLLSKFCYKFNVTALTRTDVDLRDTHEVVRWFKNKQYDIVIHTAVVGGSRLRPDDESVLHDNVAMHQNLIAVKEQFGKFITFGSGAEIFATHLPYGMSKTIIADSINSIDNWYNLRIYGAFDENEWPSRFIKSNIQRYLNKKPLQLHANKIMDFVYLPDLMTLVEQYIQDTSNILPKTVECVYSTKNTLMNILEKINGRLGYTVPIEIGNTVKNHELYCSSALGIDYGTTKYIGFDRGLEYTFNYLAKLHV